MFTLKLCTHKGHLVQNQVGCIMEGCTRVVLDTGSHNIKAGFAGESFPRVSYPTVVGRFRKPGLLDAFPIVYCGQEAVLKRGISQLTYPVQNGLIDDYDEMEKLWHHTFYKELHVPPEETLVLHSVHPLISRRDKERMAEVLFESFTIQGLYLMKSPVLVLHASGRTSGVVWESGASCTYAAPVFEGFPLKQSTVMSRITGTMITDYLQKLMAETGYSFTTPIEYDILNNIKAECCYISKDFESDLMSSVCSGDNRFQYTLPDGQTILLGDERFKSPEILFKPHLFNVASQSIVDDVCQSIATCELEYREMFFENIVIGGGTSLFPGLKDRLQTEVSLKLVKERYKAKVDTMPSRIHAAWSGGSILASLPIVNKFWMTRSEYEDGGSDRVHYRFF